MKSAPCRSSMVRAIRKAPKKFYDWALSADAQSLALQVKAYQVPSNKGVRNIVGCA